LSNGCFDLTELDSLKTRLAKFPFVLSEDRLSDLQQLLEIKTPSAADYEKMMCISSDENEVLEEVKVSSNQVVKALSLLYMRMEGGPSKFKEPEAKASLKQNLNDLESRLGGLNWSS
jgi:hypothetical protein